jgi:hypothetical protein
VTAAQESTAAYYPKATPDRKALGVLGNQRLTAWAGASLLAGFAAQGFTILFSVRYYLSYHILIGIALFLPVGVKVASTGYKFARYYLNDPAYRRQGPPPMPLRILGPVLVLATAAVLLSGVGILFAGSSKHLVEEFHKLVFWAWLGLAGLHVLAHVWRLPALLLADLMGRQTPRAATFQRVIVVLAAGVLGLALAAAVVPWAKAQLG